jgi:hypothetical protein
MTHGAKRLRSLADLATLTLPLRAASNPPAEAGSQGGEPMQLRMTEQQSIAPRIEIEIITPEKATDLYQRNFKNRPLRQHVVDKYARDMAADNWHFTGDALQFDKDGNLLNGQHRLAACMKSGVPFKTVVVYNVPTESRLHMDSGATRTLGDSFALDGHANANHLTAVLRLMFAYRANASLNNVVPSRTELLAILDRHPNLPPSVAAGLRAYGLSRSIAGFVHYVGSELLSRPDAAATFIDVLASGVPSVPDGCPVHRLRERLLRTERVRLKREEILNASIHAWNLLAANRRITILKWGDRVRFDDLDPAKI